MQKAKSFIYFSFVAGVLLTTSCKKTQVLSETPNDVQATSMDVQVLNGRLVFSDTTSFAFTIRYLKSNGSRKLKQWDQGNGITSLEETYRSIDEKIAAHDSSNKVYKPALNEMSVFERAANGTILWIPDRTFASILNSKGECQIGDTIYKVTQRKVYSVHKANEILFQKDDLTNPAVKATDVKNLLPVSKLTVITYRSGNFNMWYTLSTEVDINNQPLPKTWNGRPTRLFACQWNVVWGLYSSHGVRSQYEYRSRWSGWLDNDCAEIYVKGESAIIRPSDDSRTIIYVSNEDVKYNDDVAEATLQVHPSVLFMEIVWSHSTHRAIYKGAIAQIIL